MASWWWCSSWYDVDEEIMVYDVNDDHNHDDENNDNHGDSPTLSG